MFVQARMVGGLDGTLSPLAFRQVGEEVVEHLQAVEEEELVKGGWRSRRQVPTNTSTIAGKSPSAPLVQR